MYTSRTRTRGTGLPDLLAGVGIGVALAYLFDSQLGRRRRSLIRDQLARAVNRSVQAADVTVRDVQHRIAGSLAELRTSLTDDNPSDELLVARVRSQMGRHVSHPSLIEVSASDGHVTLTGQVLDEEQSELVSAIRSVRGVKSVENLLQAHSRSENLPQLQGNGRRGGGAWPLMQKNWSPTTRLLVGTTGWSLLTNCATGRGPVGTLGGVLGFGLFLRALTNLEVKRLFGLAPERRGINLRKTVTIDAPVETVFSLLGNPENYPRFTDTVTSVHKTAEGHYDKRMRGPMGVEVKLEEIITRSSPPHELAWASGPQSELRYAGSARFESDDDRGTRVHLWFTYNPPGGVVGHAAAKLTGFDPKTYWDDVLMRAKAYLETGRQPHDAVVQAEPEVQTPQADTGGIT
ncbi:MAG: SRPBCC family protein [Thermoguttaceae bacterium]